LTIYVLRHGIAEERRKGRPDATRALTAAGKQKLRAVLRRANEIGVSPDTILTSPLTRALETAEMAAEVLGCRKKPVVTKTLLPSSSPGRVWKEVSGIRTSSVLIAGHEPLLSQVISFLLQCPALQVDLKKGALVRVDMASSESGPGGTLKWMLTPKLAGT
jgi:phosphohistidine phosphatase